MNDNEDKCALHNKRSTSSVTYRTASEYIIVSTNKFTIILSNNDSC